MAYVAGSLMKNVALVGYTGKKKGKSEKKREE